MLIGLLWLRQGRSVQSPAKGLSDAAEAFTEDAVYSVGTRNRPAARGGGAGSEVRRHQRASAGTVCLARLTNAIRYIKNGVQHNRRSARHHSVVGLELDGVSIGVRDNPTYPILVITRRGETLVGEVALVPEYG